MSIVITMLNNTFPLLILNTIFIVTVFSSALKFLKPDCVEHSVVTVTMSYASCK